MKDMRKSRYFILGVIFTFILNLMVTPAVASMIQKQITVSTGVNIYVDDTKLNPKDSSGNPVEVFIYNGTTYLPVRAVAEAVGKPVFWDAKSISVYLGEHDSEEPTVMLQNLDYFNRSANVYRENEVIKGDYFKDNFGTVYTNFISFSKNYSKSWNDYKIDGKYRSMKGTIALNYDKRDDTDSGNFRVYGDEKLLYTSPSMTAGSDTIDFNIDITGVLTLRIEFNKEGQLGGMSKNFAIVNTGLYQ